MSLSSTSVALGRYAIVVAATQTGGIGNNGDLPWGRSLKGDMRAFAKLTTEAPEGKINVVIMGSKTWRSIPQAFRPLKNRRNFVLTRQPVASVAEAGMETFPSLADAIAMCDRLDDVHRVFVMGGSELYREALWNPLFTTIHLTHILKEFECDVHIPVLDLQKEWKLESSGDVVVEAGIPYQMQILTRGTNHPNIEEQQYLDLVRRILYSGVQKGDRTGTGTLSVFGAPMRFCLRDGRFPLLTSKKIAFRLISEELFWILKGCTDAKKLAEKKVHIWDGNGTREFLDKQGFKDREVGDLGPGYGWQMRNYNAQYKDCHTAATKGEGVDQLAEAIHLIKTNPNDRRILINMWNPLQIKQMSLPPCHVLCQFYVANGELSCTMYQRSCDLALGIPYNIASYSLLTCMIAHVCGLKPAEFIHFMGDTHIYNNHIGPMREQLTRSPRPFPTISIKRQVPDIESFTFEDFELTGYNPHGAIKMKMAV